MNGNDIFATCREDIVDPSKLTRRELLSAIYWLNQELAGRAIFGGAAACDYVERELKRTTANSKPMLIERFYEMVDELIGIDPYYRVLRIYRKKKRQSTSRLRIAGGPSLLALSAWYKQSH